MTTDHTCGPDSPYLTLPEAAAFLRLSRRFLERLIADETLPVVRFGRTVRIKQSDLIKLADRATERPVGGRTARRHG